ncbi:MAG: hypothetical protein R2799_04685 [Crocinitomicaceae bacterium]
MKKIANIGLILLATVFVSCKKQPVACMELSTETASVGQAVTFTTCSENALSYDWYFVGPVGAPENDLGYSEITFDHAFSTAGTYTVVHVAFQKFSFLGESDTTTQVITIN